MLKKSSIVDDEDEDRPRYQKLYQSGVKAVTSFKVQDYEQQRTESFRENLDHTEFKKYMEMNKKNYKQPSITQRFFNRKSVPWQHKQKNGRLSKKQVQKLQKEDLNLRKAELQQKALERKLKLEGDNFLKITRDQMMTNVCAIIFKHIEAA